MPSWLLVVLIVATSFLNGLLAGRHMERRALVKSVQKALEGKRG